MDLISSRPVSANLDRQVHRVSLDARENPWLHNHIFRRGQQASALLPGVAFIEMAYEAARAMHGKRDPLHSISRVRFHRGVFVPSNGLREPSLSVSIQLDDSTTGWHYAARLYEKSPGRPPTTFATARVQFTGDESGVAPKRLAIPPYDGATGLFTGAGIYGRWGYPNTGLMASLLTLHAFGTTRAITHLDPRAIDSRAGLEEASRHTLPVHIDLGFQSCGVLAALETMPNDDDPARGMHIFSAVDTIDFFGSPSSGELSFLGVLAGKRGPNAFNFSVVNLYSGALYARVEGLRTHLWPNPWRTVYLPWRHEVLGKDHLAGRQSA